MAIEWVEQNEWQPLHNWCMGILQEVCTELQEEGVSAQPKLMGSGKNRMVTRSGGSEIDLDYNLLLQKIPEEYRHEPGQLKDRVRVLMDRAARRNALKRGGLSFGVGYTKNSTSVLTLHLHDWQTRAVFHMDVALVWKNPAGKLCRLVRRPAPQSERVSPVTNHRYYGVLIFDSEASPAQTNDRWLWNELKGSKDFSEREKCVRASGRWQEVRERYLTKKQRALSRQDGLKSFEMYIEAVNEVYNIL